jgi:hypothetical protein
MGGGSHVAILGAFGIKVYMVRLVITKVKRIAGNGTGIAAYGRGKDVIVFIATEGYL